MQPESVQIGELCDSLDTTPMRMQPDLATPKCEELAYIEQRLARQSTQPSIMRLALSHNISEAWEAMTDDERREILNEAIDKIVISAAPVGNHATMDGIAIHWKAWLQETPSHDSTGPGRLKASESRASGFRPHKRQC